MIDRDLVREFVHDCVSSARADEITEYLIHEHPRLARQVAEFMNEYYFGFESFFESGYEDALARAIARAWKEERQ